MRAGSVESLSEHPTLSERAHRDRKKGYIPTLDGWRAVAIAWVLLGHAQQWSLGWFSLRSTFQTGGHGVELFFALSGFLICTRLLREETSSGSISLKSFYTRRLFRIQPAALTYLAVVVLLGSAGVIALYLRGVFGAALMIRNLWPPPPAPGYWYTAHFWSLAVEEHFYLLLPGFLVLCRRRRLAILSLAIIGLEIWRFIVFAHPALQQFGILIYLRTDVVLDDILLGSLFAVALTRVSFRSLAERWLRPWVALLYTAAVSTELALHTSRFDHPLLISIYPILITATVFHPDTWLGRLLELAPVRFVGRISYSLYLWQELFLDPLNKFPAHNFRSHNSLAWSAAIACAIASYFLVEKPLVKVGHRLAKRFDRAPRQNLQPANQG